MRVLFQKDVNIGDITTPANRVSGALNAKVNGQFGLN